MMKESENNDNSVVSEYTEIFEAEALSQEEIENAENTHSSFVEALDNTTLASQTKSDSRHDK